MSLGGYVTEKMVFGDLTTGPSNDLQVSTAMARDMVTKYGMSENLGPIALEGSGGKTLFGRGVNEKEYSEEVGALGILPNESGIKFFVRLSASVLWALYLWALYQRP